MTGIRKVRFISQKILTKPGVGNEEIYGLENRKKKRRKHAMNDRNYVWCSVVRDLIVEKWQTIVSDPSTLRYHNHFETICSII
jgi:hypothetical protein